MINYFRFYTFMLALKTLAASISTKKEQPTGYSEQTEQFSDSTAAISAIWASPTITGYSPSA